MTSALHGAPPRAWTDQGEPQAGTYRGELGQLSFASWDRLTRLRREKRWIWTGVFTDEVAAAVAIVRTGYAANVFVWVFDRESGVFLADVSRVLPAPAASIAQIPGPSGEVARYRGLLEGLVVSRSAERWSISGRVADIRLDLEITESADPITAICPVDEAGTAGAQLAPLNVTRKQADATATGSMRVGTRQFDIDGAGFIDFSHGMLGRETTWEWAIGSGQLEDGRRASFNIVARFNDGLENVVWVDGEPRATGIALFDRSGDAWKVEADGLELTLSTEGVRSQNLDLGLVVSEYAQPLGRWSGVIDGCAFDGVGVAEFHRSVW